MYSLYYTSDVVKLRLHDKISFSNSHRVNIMGKFATQLYAEECDVASAILLEREKVEENGKDCRVIAA